MSAGRKKPCNDRARYHAGRMRPRPRPNVGLNAGGGGSKVWDIRVRGPAAPSRTDFFLAPGDFGNSKTIKQSKAFSFQWSSASEPSLWRHLFSLPPRGGGQKSAGLRSRTGGQQHASFREFRKSFFWGGQIALSLEKNVAKFRVGGAVSN